MDRWDPDFLLRSPMLAPLACIAAPLATCTEWPTLEDLEALLRARSVANARGMALRLVPPDSGGAFEERVYLRGELAVRPGSWHDFMNVLVWLLYPRAKAALNARHYGALLAERTGSRSNRGPARDALTLFDENGAVVASTDDELLEALRESRWKRVFWERRSCVWGKARFILFGHALLAKALRPYVGMSGHAILIDIPPDYAFEAVALEPERLDGLIASRVSDVQTFVSPRALTPLPVLGVPGWWRANEEEAFYDDARYFRPPRAERRPKRAKRR